MSLKKERKKKRSNFLYDFVKITGAIPTLCWMRPKIVYGGKGKKPKFKGGLVCANHSSFVDPLLVQCAFWNRRLEFLATTDLFCSPMKRFFFSRMHCIPVDKQNFNMDSMHEVCDQLKDGKIVVVFPEGTVDHNKEELIDFKSGALLMAYLADVEILPMYLAPIKKWYQRRVVLIGEPLRIRELCSFPSIQAIDEAGKTLREKVLALKNQYAELQEKKYDKSKRKHI